jgi:hypothetical protein
MDKYYKILNNVPFGVIIYPEIDKMLEQYIRSSMSRQFIQDLINERRNKDVVYTTYNCFVDGDRSLYLDCKWIYKSGLLTICNYKRLTLDEYLDIKLEDRKKNRIPK